MFTDCSKGFNLLSWARVTAVLMAAGLPGALVIGIAKLMHMHLACLCFDGIVFDAAVFLSGCSQGHPLSTYIYIIAVDPFLRAAAAMPDARRVCFVVTIGCFL